MAQSPNVVNNWRQRNLLLERKAWQCSKCHKFSLVRRRICPACHSSDIQPQPLPHNATITAVCSSGETIETLDQLSQLCTGTLLQLNDNSFMCCQLAYSRPEKKKLRSLLGKPCRIAVRRLSNNISATAPISYGIKAVLDIPTLQSLHTAEAKDSS